MGHSHTRHTHGATPDPLLVASHKANRALLISFIGLMATALIQSVVAFWSGSAALIADTFHNFVDAFTAIPLALAFWLSRKKPTRRYTYGFSRVEDLVGVVIIFLIFGTAAWVAYDSIHKLTKGFVPKHLDWVIGASIIGFIGNEVVARYRIKVGKEINSAALVADGMHARADAYTSLAVIFGTIGVYAGFPMADPLVGIIIAIAIVHIGWETGREMFNRLMDAISPEIISEIKQTARSIEGVHGVNDVRARYVGHQLRVDLTVEVDGKISVQDGHKIAIQVHQNLKKKFPELVSPNIHVDPQGVEGEEKHFI